MKRSESEAIFSRGCRVTPGGVNSPVRACSGLLSTPLIAKSAQGDTLWDEDGNRFIDFCGSWGALIHGHAHPSIVESAIQRLKMGSTFGISTKKEAELAELISEHLPWIEKIRFVSSGTEATMSAIRLARGFTGKETIIKFSGHYHGHADSLLVEAGSGVSSLHRSSSQGVPHDFVKHTLCLPFNDPSLLRTILRKEQHHIAAVILEPIAANMGLVEPTEDFLKVLQEETKALGILLIFDEVITGFRVHFGGAASYYSIKPDLCCYGKIVGGGFPAAAFGGRAEIMDHLAPIGSVYQAGTLSGNPVAMEAGFAALKLCLSDGFYAKLEEKTTRFLAPIQEKISKERLNICLKQRGSMFTLFFGVDHVHSYADAKACNVAAFREFFLKLFSKGIYCAPSQFEVNFVSAAHTDENLNYAQECFLEALV